MTSQSDKARKFRSLHERDGFFIIPNPWDVGSARLLAAMGFEALATTSMGFAYSLGRMDGKAGRDDVLAHCRTLSAASDLPVSADFENAFADAPRQAAENILRAAETGLVGCSIEDFTGDPSRPIYDFELAVERVSAAAEAVQSLGFPFTLTARAENLLHGVNDLDDTIRRLRAFEVAGADVLYAPGLKTLEDVRRVTGALSKPVNVLASMVQGANAEQLGAAGAKRISVGGALARAALGSLLRAGMEMRDQGSFDWLADIAPVADVNRMLGTF
ncbi:MAG TPA: isocitrate lyase/phosphoenolpyruvate mutase family protein [Gammaproteobacteria bacterium]|nr:isocitrate lyase/phosphoenolpyruvate mutase family protein [Gammaproteobacteria bacterium]